MEFFKEATLEDFESYYRIKCQKDAILWSGFSTAPNKEKLLVHYKEKIINNPNTYLFYLWNDYEIIGSLQGSRVDADIVEIGASNVFQKFQGLGYVQDLTSLFIQQMKKLGYKKAICWVSDRNKPSEYNTKINKFVKTEDFEDRSLPLLGGKHRFYKWEKQL